MRPIVPVIWLVLLIALPCTAPFSTCDLSDLVPGHPRPSQPISHAPDVSGADHALPHTAAAARVPRTPRTLRATTTVQGGADLPPRTGASADRHTPRAASTSRERHRILRI